ncbi:CDP-glycerol glycerophosphotransferase family protein [Lacticaseibacillus suihuaensis]
MKTIAILGFNIFAVGGTSRSNINLLTEFGQADYQITFYNFRGFTDHDVKVLRQAEPAAQNVTFKYVEALKEDALDYDVFFITRESFFCVAPYIRANSQALVVGEIHAPLALVEDSNLTHYLKYFSTVRVATPSIQAAVARRFHFDRTYVQTVSLAHIATTPQPFEPALVDAAGHVNLIIRARFDTEKDFPSALKLMDYLIHALHRTEFRLYITGYGAGQGIIDNLIAYYKLGDYVTINPATVPACHLYLSTSNYETLGYSIIEEFAQGHAVVMYGGRDHVVHENFGAFADCLWIQKRADVDAPALLDFLAQPRTQAAYQHNLALLKQMKADYVPRFEANTAPFAQAVGPINSAAVTYAKMWANLQEATQAGETGRIRKLYTALRQIPGFRWILKHEGVRKVGRRLVQLVMRRGLYQITDEPISSHKVFLESFHGNNLSGDPKYFGLKIKALHPDTEVYVSSMGDLVDAEAVSLGFTPVRVGSLKYLQSFQQSKYVFINGNSLDKAGKRDGQVFVQTWHGFPMKQMVNDLADPKQRRKEAKAFAPRMKKWDYLTTSSSYNVTLLQSAFRLADNPELKILHEGTPKNDYLLTHAEDAAEKKRIYEKYFNRTYDPTTKIVLFCPTWRKGNRKRVSNLDLKQVADRLPADYQIIVKLHPLEGQLRDQYAALSPKISCFYNEMVDIQELYVIATVLISDYSSAIYDYALLNKPIIVLQEDEAAYAKQIGWYFDNEEETGLKGRAYTTAQLTEAILHPQDTSASSALIKSRLMTDEQSGATERMIKQIMA